LLATTSLVLVQMSKSLAGLSHDIQTVAHASSPFSATIASTSILPLTTHPVIGDNAPFSLKRPRAPLPLRKSPVRPPKCSRITWLLVWIGTDSLHGRVHTVLVDVYSTPYLGLSRLTFQYVLSYLCSVGRYQYSNIVTLPYFSPFGNLSGVCMDI
jgi:hypothetical protein